MSQGTGLWHNFSSPTTNRKLILLTLVSVLVCYNQEFARAWISFGILRDLILLETWFESKIFSNSFALNKKKNLHQRINPYGKLILKLFYFRIILNFISTFSKNQKYLALFDKINQGDYATCTFTLIRSTQIFNFFFIARNWFRTFENSSKFRSKLGRSCHIFYLFIPLRKASSTVALADVYI